jgi:hypothetical protein
VVELDGKGIDELVGVVAGVDAEALAEERADGMGDEGDEVLDLHKLGGAARAAAR